MYEDHWYQSCQWTNSKQHQMMDRRMEMNPLSDFVQRRLCTFEGHWLKNCDYK